MAGKTISAALLDNQRFFGATPTCEGEIQDEQA
jgi:hypothetical protein